MTLIELMVGLVIILIGMTVAIPSFRGMIARNNVITNVNDFVVAVSFARNEASRRSGTVTLQANLGGGGGNEFGLGYCVTAGNPGNCATPIRVFTALPQGMALDSENALTAIVFDSLGGLATPATLTFDLCHPQVDGRRVIISPIGRAKIHRDTDAVAGNRPTC